ncbi:MAG: NADH-quinone oxidoreductase subunit D [Mycobacterium sp.]|nr:MAG: NADH-quinone oxidoreductase subunit D [Mycobacterium sp.]
MVVMERICWAPPPGLSHPAADGSWQVQLDVADDMVVAAEVVTGRLHRGAEKLFESRDYRAALALADRHDWLGAFGSEASLAKLVERMVGITVPPRAAWLRALLAEQERIAHHLLWLSATAEVAEPTDSGAAVAAAAAAAAAAAGFAARERLLDLLERYCGGRMHPMVNRVGGLAYDCDDPWLDEAVAAAAGAAPAAAALGQALGADDRLHGLATLTAAQAKAAGASGPLARAAGWTRDLRLDRPSPVEHELAESGALRRVTRTDGDAAARFGLLADEVAVSAACVEHAADRIRQTTGPVAVALPRSVRVPVGHGYLGVENPAGINGWYLVADGGPTPYRLKLRTASFGNARSLAHALPGTALADVDLAMMSYLLVQGDLDK